VSEIHSHEREFWDAVAEREGEPAPPRAPDRFDTPLLDALGPVVGLTVLELGCGLGDLSLELLRRGARLTALDLSPASVGVLRERAERFAPGAELRPVVAQAEETGLDTGAFDRVVGKWILHHLDVPAAVGEVRRLLRPGGSAVFFENQQTNPLLRFARRRMMGLPGVHRVGTPDESPLGHAELALIKRSFDRCELSYPNMYFLEAAGRALGRGMVPLRRADGALGRIPQLRRWSHYVLVKVANA
jgi:SAM-dependent methyltransferase